MTVQNNILIRLQKQGRGKVYCLNDFLDLGSRNTIGVALYRLTLKGILRRIGPGVYDYPKMSSIVGPLSPDIKASLDTYARKNGCVFTPHPLSAAHSLHLTTQVPAMLTYLTDGVSHTLSLGGVKIRFIHTCPKKLVGAGKKAGIVIQALRYFNNQNISNAVLRKIAANLNKNDQKDLQAIRLKTIKGLIPYIDKILSYA
jgi:hypothetical protein